MIARAPENKSLRVVPRRVSAKKRTKKGKNIMAETKPEPQPDTPIINTPPPKLQDNISRRQHLTDKHTLRSAARGPAQQGGGDTLGDETLAGATGSDVQC